MIYIAIQHLTDDGESLYKTNTLHQAFQMITDRSARNFTISDMPFLNDDAKEIPDNEYQLLN